MSVWTTTFIGWAFTKAIRKENVVQWSSPVRDKRLSLSEQTSSSSGPSRRPRLSEESLSSNEDGRFSLNESSKKKPPLLIGNYVHMHVDILIKISYCIPVKVCHLCSSGAGKSLSHTLTLSLSAQTLRTNSSMISLTKSWPSYFGLLFTTHTFLLPFTSIYFSTPVSVHFTWYNCKQTLCSLL